jgi:mono/diheme cytochrome c family protein
LAYCEGVTHQALARQPRYRRVDALMTTQRQGAWFVVAVLVAATAFADAAAGEAGTADAIAFFERRIRPVLIEHCYECHSAKLEHPEGGLRLDSASALMTGGDSGPAVAAGNPGESLLLAALRYESYEMPPTGKLSDDVIADFEQWIASGAIDPRDEPAAGHDGMAVGGDPREHWAFQRPKSQTIADENIPNEIDGLIRAQLAARGLRPSLGADARTLLRRLSYDLTGLPPTADELEAFAEAFNDAAYTKAVDRLLASPRFGERWGRYWLDVARYADTKGYLFEEDRNYKTAFKYRDWIIEALNEDLPYDEFVVAQLAADQLDDAKAKPAMGFLTLGRRFLNNPHDINDDRIDLVTRGLMGVTVACARCHDHKYDPVPTADYYSLYGVLASSKEMSPDDGPPMLVDAEQPVEQVVFLRGQPGNNGPHVTRHFLSCLSDDEPQPFSHGSGRLELARAIASPDNPLTARVWVNRIWAHLFGRGIVGTPSDFGVRGDPPTHPELLDALATHFMADGWSTKRLIRSIVLSATYRQSSLARDEALAVDPENQLLWRMNRRRLDLEAFRDSLLFAAGKLDLTMGGPSVQLTEAPFATRRAVYGFIERQNLPAFFRTFDFANPNTHTAARPQTASPQQALFLLNSPFVREQAKALADRTAAANGGRRRFNQLYRLALGRSPSFDEFSEVNAFLAANATPKGDEWVELAHVLLMSNEFVFVD